MLKVRLYKQQPGFCGPTALRIAASYFGVKLTKKQLAVFPCTPERGITFQNLAKGARSLGFSCKPYIKLSYEQLMRFVSVDKKPVIVGWFHTDEAHYSVVVDVNERFVFIADSYEYKVLKMTRRKFMSVWFDITEQHNIRSSKQFIIRPALVVHDYSLSSLK